MASWTNAEIKQLMARILGGNIDTGEGADEFISTGPSANRTVLEGDIRQITRKINALNSLIDFIDSGVNGFDSRFTSVVGSELSEDFTTLGGNIIQVLADMKEKLESGEYGGGGGTGKDGVTPHIDPVNGHWFIGETDTGVRAEGPTGPTGGDGITPHIDPISTNWFIGDFDTGIKAEGVPGSPGLQGNDGANGVTPHIDPVNGHWFIGETDTGVKAEGPAGPSGDNGDMLQSIYDPQGKATDIFAYVETYIGPLNASLQARLDGVI